ncbi:MAG: CpaF family protein, partial [Chloroflexota bacterium]
MSLLRRIEKGGGDSGGGGDDQRKPPSGGGEGEKRQRPTRQRAVQGSGGKSDGYADLKTRVQTRLLQEMDGTSMDISKKDQVRAHIEELFNNILAEESMVLSRSERKRLFEAIVAEILGFGPIEILLSDESISEVMVNGPK